MFLNVLVARYCLFHLSQSTSKRSAFKTLPSLPLGTCGAGETLKHLRAVSSPQFLIDTLNSNLFTIACVSRRMRVD